MTVYVALLRGVNVGGKKIVMMGRLRETFASLGFENIKTYINSGNIVFKSSAGSPAILSKKIGEEISSDFGFEVPVFLRTSGQLVDIVSRNPFLKERSIDDSRLHVTFLSESPSKTAVARVDSLDGGPDRFKIVGTVIYLYTPGGYGRTKLSNAVFERILGVQATTRNWRTVIVLAKMCVE